MARQHVPFGRVACLSCADLAAVAIASHAAPRAAWWLPWVTAGGGTLVLAAVFGVLWLADRRRVVSGRPAAARPAVRAGYVLRIEPGWPRSQWPQQIGTRTALPGPSGDAIAEGGRTIMGLFGKKESAPDCRACGGSGVVQTGTSKWTGAKFSPCTACGGTGRG